MKSIANGLCAALLLTLGFATSAAAQLCTDGEILLISNHSNNATVENPADSPRALNFNAGFNGANMQSYFDRLVASDGFSPGGAFFGFKPVFNAAPLGEFADMIMSVGTWDLEYRDAAQILRCPSAKKLSPASWQRYCNGDDRFEPGVFVLSGGHVRPFDMDKLPIDPLRCSDPPRRAAFDYRGWSPIDSGRPGHSAVSYRSPNMLPGEEATLLYSGTSSGEADYGGETWPNSTNAVFLLLALTSGDKPITGFGGVTLNAADGGKGLETLYAAKTEGDGGCGVGTLGSLPDGSPAMCSHACFRTHDDLAAQSNPVSCGTGDARWILIVIGGELSQKRGLHPADSGAARVQEMLDREAAERAQRGESTLTEKVDGAGLLVAHVKWDGVDYVTFPVDEMLRTALWDPERR